MAGFEFARKTFVLEFEDEALAGLEVRARSASTGTFLSLLHLAQLGSGDQDMNPAAIEELLTGFAEVLVSWNVEIDGEQVPANLDGLKRVEFDNAFRIIAAWIRSTAAVSGPLGPESSGGKPLEVGSIPMAPLSESRAS